jgi:hypothetical protein
MNTKIKNASSKLDKAIINLECVLNESAKVFKKYVKTILTEVDDNIEVDTECFNFCVTYDGGRHPEYDANPFSQIERIYLKDGKIYVETEDADGLSFDDLDVLDKQTVAECLAAVIEDNYELDE